ncbi:MAG: T9SS type A sorting domain-containing protein [Ignavibacteriaceae bacterium]|jgi:uncharacterized protein (TIGR02145 family)|nr:T9SS type A sorting domain-containing protein [Ignavibacteriaceae bacterium]
MKKLLFLLAIYCTLQANAQPYSISFSGTDLLSVKVENLQSGLIVNLNAGDILLLSTPTGIPEVKNLKSSGLKIYPNPMTDKSTLEILPPVAGDATISVCDMTGKVLTQFKGYVENYKQEFSLSGIKNGLYIINVQGNGYQFSEKLLSNRRSSGKAIIARVSNNIQTVAEKKSIQDSKGVKATVDMAYNAGQRLKYTAVSGNNKTVMTDIPTEDKTVTFTFTECKDGDNIYYPIVVIGTQTWMAENLKTTKFKDGTTSIPNVTGDAEWAALSTPSYCWSNNEIANKDTYGALYNWYTVNTGNLCPTGWHVPTDGEWTIMENYLIANGYNYDGTTTGNQYAKALASTTLWISSTTTGAVGNTDYPAKRNSTGFTALPGGYRLTTGQFPGVGYYGRWWSATEDTPLAWTRYLYQNYNYVHRYSYNKKYGYSVRCMKD